CVACHNTPGTSENDPQKIPLNHVREKFAPGGLVAFLRQPAEHYDWIRMPDFKLTADEVAHLADFLRASAERPKDAPLQTDSAAIERGKRLVQISGCLNCHALRIENVFKAVSLAELTPDKWTRGCLAEKPDEDSKAPRFSFTASEREALRAFGATDRASLARHAPVEFAERQARILRCAECHGKFEGFPPL